MVDEGVETLMKYNTKDIWNEVNIGMREIVMKCVIPMKCLPYFINEYNQRDKE